MRITKLHIKNFRGLKDCEFQLESLTTVVGPNNAGKSSLLLALKLFFSRTKLAPEQFYNPLLPIRIEIKFDDISQQDLERIVDPEHRTRVEELVRDGTASFVLQYETTGKAELKCRKLAPTDDRLTEARVGEVLAGTRGAGVAAAMKQLLPEYAIDFEGITTQGAAREAAARIVDRLSPEDLVEVDAPLITGIPASLNAFFPEPILIPAVKDVRDELKTTESSTFGKLVGILLGIIEETDQIRHITDSLARLHALLNTVADEEGLVVDGRLDEVKTIERRLKEFLNESFPGIDLQIEVPKPELRTIFSTAKITLDDGIKGDVESKGDGLKRSVIFALLRTYVELTKEHAGGVEFDASHQTYLFLFEEPELYLYPSAQKILFDALSNLSLLNQVLITTHSPSFLSPTASSALIKLVKRRDEQQKLETRVVSVDIVGEIAHKDAFQLICFENNAAGFFAEKVVLVEGDADLIFFEHAYRCVHSGRSPEAAGIVILRIFGKSNVKRYKDFFEKFDVEVHCILDRDVLLDGFDKLAPSQAMVDARQSFLTEIDRRARASGLEPEITGGQVRELVRRYSWRQRYDRLKGLVGELRDGVQLAAEQLEELELLFDVETVQLRRAVLDGLVVADYPQEMLDLIDGLRAGKIHVLTRGAIESYYPGAAVGHDKPAKALSACTLLPNVDAFREIEGGGDLSEIERIITAFS